MLYVSINHLEVVVLERDRSVELRAKCINFYFMDVNTSGLLLHLFTKANKQIQLCKVSIFTCFLGVVLQRLLIHHLDLIRMILLFTG